MIKYVSNIDTICVLVNIRNYETHCKKIIDFLYMHKEQAKIELKENSQNKHVININNMVFQMLPNSCKGYAFIIKNNSYELKISQYKSKIKSFYPIQVRISAEMLWEKGLFDAWCIIHRWITETFGNIIDDKICRLDICTHVSNVDFTSNYSREYKGKYKKMQMFYTGKDINCLCFGSRSGKNIYCRIYNKTLEIQETKKKAWFKEIWKNNGLDINNVWNIEFEIKSEFLHKYDLHNVLDVLGYLKSIWQYCTKEWLVKIDRNNERVERCPVNCQWKEIQYCYDNLPTQALIERKRQNQIDANMLIPNIVGSITSYSAKKDKTEILDVFANLLEDTQIYLESKRTDFTKEVIKKQKIINGEGKSEQNE